MSSGDSAKPPATSYEERNPFDIARRSEKDVASEIAQRMAAWKQARGRSYATPSTVPTGEAKLPAAASPVQPARLPKFTEPVAQMHQPAPQLRHTPTPSFARPAGGPERAPLFAAARRAMPAAPSLRPPAARSEPLPQPPERAAPEIDAAEIDAAEMEVTELVAPVAEGATIDSVEPVTAETVRDAETSEPAADGEAAEIEAPTTETPCVVDASAIVTLEDVNAAPASPAIEAAADPIETREIELASVDLAAPEMPGADPAIPEIEAHEIEDPLLETSASRDTQIDAPVAEAYSAEPPVPEFKARDVSERPVEAPDAIVPTIDAQAAEMREVELALLASSPIDGRREPIFRDAMAWKIGVEMAAFLPPIKASNGQSRRVEAPGHAGPGIDPPAADARAHEPDLQPTSSDESRGVGKASPDDQPAESGEVKAVAEAPPMAESPNAADPTRARPIALPSIETRIERRRLDTLRADPQMAGRRPISAPVKPEARVVPPLVVPPLAAARARRQPRGGTGWAIGLGAVLLIAGITAPAAIWQGRQQTQTDQGGVALLPATQTPPSTPETVPASPATLSAAPQPPSSPTLAQAPTPSAAAVESSQVTPPAAETTAALSDVRDSGEVAPAPITAPPSPSMLAADKSKAPAQSATEDGPFIPVARPFVPEQMPTPFLAGVRTQTSPSLMGQLKPKAPPPVRAASNTPQKTVRKPSENARTLDQMFDTLINTLSNGQPVNPANKPPDPSTRR